MAHEFKLTLNGTNIPVMDPGMLRRNIAKFGLDISHLPGIPNSIHWPTGAHPGNIYLLVQHRELMIAGNLGAAWITHASSGQAHFNPIPGSTELEVIWTDKKQTKKIILKRLIFMNAYSIAGNFPDAHDQQAMIIHLRDDREGYDRTQIAVRYNLPKSSTGTDEDKYDYINDGVSPDIRWTWAEVMGNIASSVHSNIVSQTGPLWLVDDYEGFPTVSPSGIRYFGWKASDALADMTMKAGAIMFRKYNGEYELQTPSYKRTALTNELKSAEYRYQDGGNYVQGLRTPSIVVFLFPKFEPKGTDKNPFEYGTYEVDGGVYPEGGSIYVVAGAVALMNSADNAVNDTELATHASDIGRNVADLFSSGDVEDLIFSGLLQEEIDSRYQMISIYDTGHGLFTRLRGRNIIPPVVNDSLRPPGLGGHVIRFELRNSLTTSESYNAAEIIDSDSSLDGELITVYNPETTTSGLYFFEGSITAAGLAVQNEAGKWIIIQMECPF